VIKRSFLIIFILSFISTFAQVKFYVKANNLAYVGQSYAVSFVIENPEGKNLRLPKEFPGFEIIGGPSRSEKSSSGYNGSTYYSITYLTFTYYLQASKVGTYTIPSASLEVDNESITTEPFKVVVKKLTKEQEEELEEQRQMQNDPFGYMMRKMQQLQNQQRQQQNEQNNSDDTDDWREEVKKHLFVKMYVDKTTPFVGEQITLYLKLYQTQNFQISLVDIPKFDGFWVNEISLNSNKTKREKVDGVYYSTRIIAKYVLIPQREGSFNLSPLKLEAEVRLRNYNSFRGYDTKNYKFQTNTVKINVKPLPEINKPKNFSGAVGSFKYTAKIDSTNIQTGRAITLKTKIVGTGNIMMLEPPKIKFPEEFEIYDPQEKEYISKKRSKINGSKKYDYLLIPKEPGKYKIDSISFSYFDLATENYKTIYTNEFNINVTPSSSYLEENKNNPKEEKVLDSDIRDIASFDDTTQEFRLKKFINSYTFWSLWLSPAIVFFLLLIGKNKIKNYNPDLVGKNRRKANKIALAKLKQANIFLKQNDKKSFYNEIVRALWDYVSLKLNIQKEDLSKENIQEKLLEQNVKEQTAIDYINLIKKSEMAVFSPIGETEMKKDFDIAKEIIISVESEIK